MRARAEMVIETDLLIVGAGPYGIGIAAYAKSAGLDALLVGVPMSFWRKRMPAGMYLRSSWDWHFDPNEVNTIEAWLRQSGRSKIDIDPFPLADYLDFAEWFQHVSGIEALPYEICQLDLASDGKLVATTSDGTVISANRVVLALGFGYFADVPASLAQLLPNEYSSHTVDFVDFSGVTGRNMLIIGGRQSAYEWTALLHEAGAANVHVSHRHRMPDFAPSDWSWVTPLVERISAQPFWYRNLSDAQKRRIAHRLWEEGRGKVESWLESRVMVDGVFIWPETQVVRCCQPSSGSLQVGLSSGEELAIDRVVYATGYRPDVNRVPLLRNGNLLGRIAQRDGCPILDTRFQTSVPGLYMTSLLATADFGPLFAFTAAVRPSSQLLVDDLVTGG